MKRNIFLVVLISLLALFVTSCSTTQRTVTVRTGVVSIAPVIADLNIQNERKEGKATNSSSVPVETIKNAAIRDVVEKNNGDVLVAPIYIIDNNGINTSVTVRGYVATYNNIRQQGASLTTQLPNDVRVATDSETSATDGRISVIDNETSAIDSKTSATGGQTSVVDNETSAKVDETSAIDSETSVTAGQTSVVDNETFAKVDETSAIDSETTVTGGQTSVIDNETFVKVDETSATGRRISTTETSTKGEIALAKLDTTNARELKIGQNNYSGEVRNGVPHGEGVIRYNVRTKIPEIDNIDVYASKGGYLVGKWHNGELEFGTLFNRDGEEVSSIAIGR